mmetsp:Transcript_29750/g.70930  ORF Transcript_29750/g.70930 Transcript_29750/m.70930 type:complete len:222 (+) Transcript_29750:871-1536(+)
MTLLWLPPRSQPLRREGTEPLPRRMHRRDGPRAQGGHRGRGADSGRPRTPHGGGLQRPKTRTRVGALRPGRLLFPQSGHVGLRLQGTGSQGSAPQGERGRMLPILPSRQRRRETHPLGPRPGTQAQAARQSQKQAEGSPPRRRPPAMGRHRTLPCRWAGAHSAPSPTGSCRQQGARARARARGGPRPSGSSSRPRRRADAPPSTSCRRRCSLGTASRSRGC